MDEPITGNMVSIIIPAYKAGKYLPETLASIAKQTHTSWELLICEDGCFDDTANIVESFSKSIPQSVRFFSKPLNQGVCKARNLLLDQARGDFIAFLDADDLWDPDHLIVALTALKTHETDWSVGAVRFIDGNGKTTGREDIPPCMPADQIPMALLRSNFILPSAMVLKRSPQISKLRFDERYPIGEDLDFCISLVAAGAKPSFQPRPTASYRKHAGGATADPVRFPEEFSRVFEKWNGHHLTDPQFCKYAIKCMLTDVIKMCWRQQPKRALHAGSRLSSLHAHSLQSLTYIVLARASSLFK